MLTFKLERIQSTNSIFLHTEGIRIHRLLPVFDRSHFVVFEKRMLFFLFTANVYETTTPLNNK